MAGKVGKKMAPGRVHRAAKKKMGARTGKASISKTATKKSSRARTPARPAKAAKRVRGAPVNSAPTRTAAKPSKPRSAQVTSAPARTTTTSSAPRMPTSPAAQKKLVGEHLRALLEQKKLRATRTPAWQKIEHHDHAPREADHQPHGGVAVGEEAGRDPDDRGES